MASEEAEVADAVDDEGLFAGVGGGVSLEVEADEQVGGEADALPADEEEQEARGEDEHEHEEHEEVEVGEEAPVTLFMRHVAGGVEMDEEADAGDDGEHDEGEVVDREGEVDGEVETCIQGRERTDRTPMLPESMVDQSQATSRAGMAVKRRAMAVTAGRASLRPRVPLRRKPRKGRIGMSQRYEAGIYGISRMIMASARQLGREAGPSLRSG